MAANLHTKRQPTQTELEVTSFHELFHGYFERYRRSRGKKVYLLATEMTTHIATREYLAKNR